MRKKDGLIIVLSAPSGCGKTTVTELLLRRLPRLRHSISATTRQRRGGEKARRDYLFLTEKAFHAKRQRGHFIEWAKVFEHYYGTPKDYVYRNARGGNDVILTIDVQGARTIRKKVKKGVFIFLVPPSLATLKKRLVRRASESRAEIAKRLRQTKRELREAFRYDYVVVNDSAERAVDRIMAIIQAEKHTIIRNKEVIRGLCSS